MVSALSVVYSGFDDLGAGLTTEAVDNHDRVTSLVVRARMDWLASLSSWGTAYRL